MVTQTLETHKNFKMRLLLDRFDKRLLRTWCLDQWRCTRTKCKSRRLVGLDPLDKKSCSKGGSRAKKSGASRQGRVVNVGDGHIIQQCTIQRNSMVETHLVDCGK